MINMFESVQMLASVSGGNSEPWMALAMMVPFFLIWIVWILVILLFWGLMFVVTIGGSILWLFMLVDLLKREFENKDDKLVWVLILALTGVVGGLIYYFMVVRK